MEEQVPRHQDPQEQEVEEMEERQSGKVTLRELAGSLGLSSKTARRLLRRWRKETKRDQVEPPYSRWEWDLSDPEEAQALEEAALWLETQAQLLRGRKRQE
jgi:transposase